MRKIIFTLSAIALFTTLNAQTIKTYSGQGHDKPGSSDGVAKANCFINHPEGMVKDSKGRIFVAVGDSTGHIYMFHEDGKGYAKRIGNNTKGGFKDADGVTTEIAYPSGLAIDSLSPLKGDTIFFMDGNYAIRRAAPFTAFTTRQGVKTICGGGTPGDLTSGTSGYDQKTGTDARFSNTARSIAINPVNGYIIVIDEGNNVIRAVTRSGHNKVVVGINGKSDAKDGAVATATLGVAPTALFVDDNGDYYWYEANEFVIRKYDATKKTVETVLEINKSMDYNLAFPDGNLMSMIKLGGSKNTKFQAFLSMGCKVVYIEKEGTKITEKVIAGQKGDAGKGEDDCGDKDGSASTSKVDLVTGMLMLNESTLLISDKNNHKIKEVDLKGFFTSVKGNESIQNESFVMFPNPAQNIVHIKLRGENNTSTQVQVIDMSGRTVLQTIFNGAQHTLPVSDLQNGVYLIQVQSAKGVLSHRLVISH